jgi:hypothetical protein
MGWCLFLLAALLAVPLPGRAQKIEVTTENGVAVIRNPISPVPPPGGPSQLNLREDLVIGKKATAAGYLFAELRSIGVDDEGYIWTLDWEDIKVRVFDKTGKLISTFGKKGQGPQEIENPSRMVVTPDGTAAIVDLNKLSFWSRDGRCLSEVSTAKTRLARLRIDSRGFIYGDSFDLGEKWTMKVHRYDPDMNRLATVAVYEEPFQMGSLKAFTPLILFHVMRDDRLVWLATPRYEFHVVDDEGKSVKRILKDYRRLKISASDRERILRERWGSRASQIKIVFPDEYPPLDLFIGDDADRLYVRTYEEDGHGGLWYDVFDAEGRCFTRFALLKEEMAFVVRKNKIYSLILENEEGLPLVKRYAMTWK